MNYTREQKMALCKKSNQNRWDGKDQFDEFTKQDKLALALWQVEVLKRDSIHQSVRDSWEKWNKLAKVLIKELLLEEMGTEEVFTRSKKVTVLKFDKDGNHATLCAKCGGSGINVTANSNVCNNCMGRGWRFITDKDIISKDKFKEIKYKKYISDCKKRRIIPQDEEGFYRGLL